MKKTFIKVLNSIVCVLLTMAVVFTGNIATAYADAEAEYWIEFDADGGTIYGALSIREPAEERIPGYFFIPDDAIPEKEGFIFKGWMVMEGLDEGWTFTEEGNLDTVYHFVDNGLIKLCKLKAIWEPDPNYKPEVKDEPKSVSDTVETVEVISSGSRAAYNFKGSNDVGIFFEGTDINQFSGFAMDFKTTAVDSKDYNVYDANGGVMFTLSKDYLDTLDKGNHTAVIFFTRNCLKSCGTIALGDLVIE